MNAMARYDIIQPDATQLTEAWTAMQQGQGTALSVPLVKWLEEATQPGMLWFADSASLVRVRMIPLQLLVDVAAPESEPDAALGGLVRALLRAQGLLVARAFSVGFRLEEAGFHLDGVLRLTFPGADGGLHDLRAYSMLPTENEHGSIRPGQAEDGPNGHAAGDASTAGAGEALPPDAGEWPDARAGPPAS